MRERWYKNWKNINLHLKKTININKWQCNETELRDVAIYGANWRKKYSENQLIVFHSAGIFIYLVVEITP